MDIPQELIDATKAAQWAILALPGVVGVGVGMREEDGEFFDEIAVRVLVADESQVPAGIPGDIAGVAISIVEARINPAVAPDLDRYAPLVGGIRIANPNKGFGTMGAIVQDSMTGELLGLSAFHVAGDGQDAFPFTLWQPDNPPLIAGGSPPTAADNIGRVVRFDFPKTQPLPFSPVLTGTIEASVFTLVPALNQGRNLSPAIAGQNQPALLTDRITATMFPSCGQEVHKRGFVTRVTEGRIIGGPVTMQWTAGPSNAYLVDQYEIATSSNNPGLIFCKQGDSGCLILDKNSPTALGLLWGESHGGTRGYMCAIRHIETQLGVNVVWQ